MSKTSVNSGVGCVPRGPEVATLRSGMAKDKLVFIIICSAAIVVAAIALIGSLSSRRAAATTQWWQCLECDDIFKKQTPELPPIECPKCSGQAVALRYRTCPQCGKNVLASRWRLTERGKAQEKAMSEAASGNLEGSVGPLVPLDMPSARETQYWVKQKDGSYGWTAWVNGADPRAAMIVPMLTCEKCGGLLYPQAGRGGR